MEQTGDRGLPHGKAAEESFDERVYALARRIPRGRVMTYGAIAAHLGDPRKAREVGWAMNHCPDDVPAQRVINRLGGLSGAPRDVARRRRQLAAEGVVFDTEGRCDLAIYEWAPEDAEP
jgi:methylated-DNA-protein-cysteine methyltransferase related protein